MKIAAPERPVACFVGDGCFEMVLGELATLQAATLQAAPDKAVAYGRQVKEILTRYGEFPAVLWWDTPTDMNKERAEKLIPLLKLQPGIIHNNRLGGGYRALFARGPGRAGGCFGFQSRRGVN
mgnify:CR=1 FL=1